MLDFGFYQMDCMQGMKEFPDGYFDLAIVDPPYGLNIGHKDGKVISVVGGGGRPFGGKKKYKVYGKSGSSLTESQYYHPFDDSSIPDEEYFKELFRVSKAQIIWGGQLLS